ncbi:hypothetical protein ETN89_20580 (plasmid) [Photobacterium damselae subsp. damselae]|uniref:hypothetical protein n=1 Tax=Photobacterium damselae TaxID=38293 RepID=UPI000A300467|nr:hypothetical protein [Photobacterium damselae]ARR51885.1 hypothetical protein CAY62_21025 [Photobacterium damselae subsp. damselae]QAY37630.1 hypothetical protein ETN89_20580 [Photobacterium damselae subsp. damselae]
MKEILIVLLLLVPFSLSATPLKTINLDENLESDNYKIVINQELESKGYSLDARGDYQKDLFEHVEETINVQLIAKDSNYFIDKPEEYKGSVRSSRPLFAVDFESCIYIDILSEKSCYIPRKRILNLENTNLTSGIFTFSIMTPVRKGNDIYGNVIWDVETTVQLKASPEAINKVISGFADERKKFERKVLVDNVLIVGKWILIVSGWILGILLTFIAIRKIFKQIPDWIGFTKYKHKQLKDIQDLKRIKRISEKEIIKQVIRNEINESSDNDLTEIRKLISQAIAKGDTQTAKALSNILYKMTVQKDE